MKVYLVRGGGKGGGGGGGEGQIFVKCNCKLINWYLKISLVSEHFFKNEK